MYSNNILNSQVSTTILNASTKKSGNLLNSPRISKKKLYTKTAAKEAVLLSLKSSSDDDPGFRDGFGAEASLPLTQGAPAVSHNTTRLYWMVFNPSECHIRSDAVTALFGIFFYIYSLFFAGECPILVKNVEVAFAIKPRHPISRGNMSVDQSFLVHCSHKFSYFSNFRWCAQSMLVSKGIVNAAIMTFFELTDQMTKSGRCRVDVIYICIYKKDKHFLYDFIKILSSFLTSALVLDRSWWMNLPKLSRALLDPSWTINNGFCKCK